MKHLQFKVNSQTLKRLDSFKPAAGSVDYLTASFTFSEDWSGTAKTAKCRKDNKIYSASIDANGVCLIPHEALAQDETKRAFSAEEFYISVEGKSGTKTITTEEIKISLSLTSAGEAVNAADPTPDLYAQYVADVTAATKENADTATAEAESAAASATEAAASAASLKNDYSNALKGKANGAVIRLDDVAPVEHFPVVKVRGKNLFNISAITNTDTATNNGDGSITVAANTYYCRLAQTLKEVCPQLNAGDTAVLSFNSTSATTKYMYFHGLQATWNVGHYITLTEDILNSYVTIYGFPDASNGQECVISDIQIEIGTTATEYTPYVDPATITLTRCGKNLVNFANFATQKTGFFANATLIKSENEGRRITVAGAEGASANAHSSGWLVLNYGNSVNLKAGDEITISADVALVSEGIYGNEIKFAIINDTAGKTSSSAAFTLGEKTRFTATRSAQADGLHRFLIMVNSNTITVENIMVSVNGETDYTDYVNGAAYTPNTNGIVEGLTSLSPTMTLLTDHEGITIDCEYNRDINKAFAMLEALLNS